MLHAALGLTKATTILVVSLLCISAQLFARSTAADTTIIKQITDTITNSDAQLRKELKKSSYTLQDLKQLKSTQPTVLQAKKNMQSLFLENKLEYSTNEQLLKDWRSYCLENAIKEKFRMAYYDSLLPAYKMELALNEKMLAQATNAHDILVKDLNNVDYSLESLDNYHPTEDNKKEAKKIMYELISAQGMKDGFTFMNAFSSYLDDEINKTKNKLIPAKSMEYQTIYYRVMQTDVKQMNQKLVKLIGKTSFRKEDVQSIKNPDKATQALIEKWIDQVETHEFGNSTNTEYLAYIETLIANEIKQLGTE